MPINRQLIEIPNDAPPAWVLYAHAVLLRAVAYGNQDAIRDWCAWAGGATFRFFPSDDRLLSNFCLITDGVVGLGVFEGTRTLSQIIGQIAASALTNDPAIPAFVSTFDRVYADAVATLASSVVPASLRNAPVLVTGHSLGGAIAHIFAARRIDGTFTNVRLLTMGQPRTGNQSLVNATTANYIRVVNQGDPTPGVPPRPLSIVTWIGRQAGLVENTGYMHGGNEWLITGDGIVPSTDDDTGTDLGAMAIALGTGIQYESLAVQYHDIGTYCYQLYGYAIANPSSPNIQPVLAISRVLQGVQPPSPNPTTAPVVPPLPPRASVMAPTFVPTPFPGHLPMQDANQPIQLIEVPVTDIPQAGTNSLFSGEINMAVLAKVTFFYQQLSQGFQEQYFCQAATIGAAQPLAEALGSALLSFRGANTSIVNYRVSMMNVPLIFPRLRQARVFPPLPTWGQGGFINTPPPNPPENWSDMFSVCVIMRGVPATPGQPAKNIFMRGLPDQYDVRGGELNGTLDQFFGMPRVQTLQRALVPAGTPFGWLGSVRPTVNFQSLLSAVVQNTNGTVSMTLTTDLLTVPPSALGHQQFHVPVRISGMRAPGNLNGSLTVWFDVTGTIMTTTKRIAIGTWDGSTGRVTYVPKSFVPFSGSIISAPVRGNPFTYGNIWAVRIGERKAGRIFGTVPGRRGNRVRA